MANVLTPLLETLNSSQKGGLYGKLFSASNFGPDSISKILNKRVLLLLATLTEGGFVERENTSPTEHEIAKKITISRWSSIASAENIFVGCSPKASTQTTTPNPEGKRYREGRR